MGFAWDFGLVWFGIGIIVMGFAVRIGQSLVDQPGVFAGPGAVRRTTPGPARAVAGNGGVGVLQGFVGFPGI